MKIGISLSNYGPIPSRSFLKDTVIEIECIGLDSIWVSDHIIVPKNDAPWNRVFESITTLGFMASITESVQLGSSIILVPLRDPMILAKQVATLDALSNGRLIVGIMTAASHGAKDANGLTVGIIPQDDSSEANEYCDVVIPTGMGFARDFLNASSADGVIIVGGGSGTLSEVCASYMYKKPMVAIRNMNGSVEQYIDDYLDHRKNVKIFGADTPKEAVQKILELITA